MKGRPKDTPSSAAPGGRPRRRPAIRWVRDPEAIAALASPLRQRLLDRLEARGPLSVRELAGALGVEPDALYYHVRRLEAVGLVAAVGARATQRRDEALYDLTARRWHIAYDARDPGRRAALQKVTRTLLRQAAADFAEGLEDPRARGRGDTRNLWSLRLEAALDDDELRALNHHLGAIVELLRRPDRRGEGEHVALSWVLAPIAGVTPSDGAEEEDDDDDSSP